MFMTFMHHRKVCAVLFPALTFLLVGFHLDRQFLRAQEAIAIYSEYDGGSLKGKTGRPGMKVYHFRNGRLLEHEAWSRITSTQGWHFSISKTGDVVFVKGTPSSKSGYTRLSYYLASASIPPDFSTEKPFYIQEVKSKEPYRLASGLSIAWSPSGKRFFLRSAFDLTLFENLKPVGTLDGIPWTAGVNWAGSDSRLGVAGFQGRKHWTVAAPLKGKSSFNSKADPYINYKLRTDKLFADKVFSSCFRVLYSPNGKYLAYAKQPGDRPLPKPTLDGEGSSRYLGPVTGFTSLRVGPRGKSIEVESVKNSAKLAKQDKFKSGFSGKTIVTGEIREISWTQIVPIGWSPNSDAFYYVLSRYTGKDVWSNSNRKGEGVFGQLKSNELWRATPSGKKKKVCDLSYLPDWERYCGNMATDFSDTNEARISSDGEYLIYWGTGSSFYRKKPVKLDFEDHSKFVPSRAARLARYLVRVDLSSGKEQLIFKGSQRSRQYSLAGFVGEQLKIKSLVALDANPIYFGDGKRLPKELLPTQLIQAQEKRIGTSADGVSQLIVRAEVSAKVPVDFKVLTGGGKLEPLLEGKTVSLQGKHYAVALYTPPKNFQGGSSKTRPSSIKDSSARPKRLRGSCTVEIDTLKLEATPVRPLAGGASQPVSNGRKELELQLARPPVVLVHGLGSNPVECWVATKSNGQSMVVALERMGIQPFCVNYEKSNGLNDPDSPHNEKIFTKPDGRDSTFYSNRKVVWDSPDDEADTLEFLKGYRWLGEEIDPGWLGAEDTEQPIIPKPAFLKIGGIKQALEFYRDKLKIAATQADVVGHSMGGLLARILADPNYNPNYRRPENFNQGDIHRLITICTPHHGSELAMLYNEVFANLVIGDESFVQWARSNVQQKLLTMFLDPNSGAITDLRYRSRALRRIGPTDLPSFAIGTTATDINLGNRHIDPAGKYLKLYSGIAMALFYNRPRLDGWIERRALRWSNAPDELKKYTDRLESESMPWEDAEDREEFKRLLAGSLNSHSYYWLKRREGAYRKKLYEQIKSTSVLPFGFIDSEMGQENDEPGIADRIKSTLSRYLLGGDVTQMQKIDDEPDIPFETVGAIRSLIFHNDSLNDGAVRLESQLGGNRANEVIPGVVHSFAPWDEKVQEKVIHLLKWDDRKFFRDSSKTSPNTFEAGGQLMPYWLPNISDASPYVYGDEAIEWSGMVKSHAEQYLFLSEENDVVIIARPVNLDSTRLIEDGAATKGMEIKGKSANWGPQKGYIPVMQRFSKIWRVFADQSDVRKAKIKKFNKQTEEMLESARYPQEGKEVAYRGRKFAVARELEVELPIRPKNGDANVPKKMYAVMIDPRPGLDSENAVFLKDKDGVFYNWRNAVDNRDGNKQQIFHYDFPPVELEIQPAKSVSSKFIPMEVLADNLKGIKPPPYLTADYDLLAIGFLNQGFEGPHPDVAAAMKTGEAPKLTGFISPPQLDLVEEFNERCDKFANYKSGYLTHHGPETQYPGSEYVDYPLLVFDPGKPNKEDANDAKYFLIKQGPPGFRDVHLKNYFWEKKKMGHNLWPNPVSQGWLWEDENSLRKFSLERGYDPRDAADLLKYVAQQKKPGAKVTAIGGETNNAPDSDPAPVLLKALRRKAEEGDRKSKFDLAFALATGKLRSGATIKVDDKQAVYWYRRAAIQGHRVAQYNLARRLGIGLGTEKNESESAYWYKKSAENGFKKAFTPTGYRYQNGKGLEQDSAEALKWYLKAYENGDATATNNLGVMAEKGQGMKQNYDLARQYYEKASSRGSALATKNLGNLYYYGKGISQNYDTALKHYLKAKELGLDDADDYIDRTRKKLAEKTP